MITIYCATNIPPVLTGIVRDLRAVWACEELSLPYKIEWLDAKAGEHRAEAEQQLFEVVVGKNRDRPLGRELHVDQRLGDTAGAVQGLRVADAAPIAALVAFGRKRVLGGHGSPVHQPVGQALRVRLQCFGGRDERAAVGGA